MGKAVKKKNQQYLNWELRIAKLKTENRLRMISVVVLILSWATSYSVNYQEIDIKPSLLPLILFGISLILFCICQILAHRDNN